MNKLVKENTKNFIIEQAMNMFLENSISGVTMSDIAHFVGIGDATLYRYFKKKQNIVMLASSKLADKVYNSCFKEQECHSGIEQLSIFYNAFLEIFTKYNSYFRFVDELDAYLISEKDVCKQDYETEINMFKNVFDAGYDKGLSDGTVKPQADREIFYYSTTHALLNLCKFLSSSAVVSQDLNIQKDKEVKTLISVILNSLKAE